MSWMWWILTTKIPMELIFIFKNHTYMKKKYWIILIRITVIIWILLLVQHFFLSKYACYEECKNWKELCDYSEVHKVCSIKVLYFHIINQRMNKDYGYYENDYFWCVTDSYWECPETENEKCIKKERKICGNIIN